MIAANQYVVSMWYCVGMSKLQGPKRKTSDLNLKQLITRLAEPHTIILRHWDQACPDVKGSATRLGKRLTSWDIIIEQPSTDAPDAERPFKLSADFIFPIPGNLQFCWIDYLTLSVVSGRRYLFDSVYLHQPKNTTRDSFLNFIIFHMTGEYHDIGIAPFCSNALHCCITFAFIAKAKTTPFVWGKTPFTSH